MKIKKVTQSVIIAFLLHGATSLPAAEEPANKTAAPEPEHLSSLSFPGGTLAEFVTRVEEAFGASVNQPNLIIPTEAASLKVPKLDLRSVDISTVISASNTLLGGSHLWQRAGSSTWVLAGRPENRETQVFFVGHLLKKFKVEDITTAIDTVWQMSRASKSELKYHQDTQLLIVRAERAHVSMAQNVLTQLRDALATDAPAEKRDTKPATAQPKS